jgi:hypothetical protein
MGGAVGRLIDPVNITGLADQTGPRQVGGSTVMGGANVDHTQHGGVNWGPPKDFSAPAAPAAPLGFLESMGAWNGKLPGRSVERLAPPPPEHWTYDPKKGASWATHNRKGNSNEFETSYDAPGSQGYNSFKGNRI